MRELQLGWNIIGLTLVTERLMGNPVTPAWPGLVITFAAAFGIAILHEMPRRAAMRKLKTQMEIEARHAG